LKNVLDKSNKVNKKKKKYRSLDDEADDVREMIIKKKEKRLI
jgi:hypothetical protein